LHTTKLTALFAKYQPSTIEDILKIEIQEKKGIKEIVCRV